MKIKPKIHINSYVLPALLLVFFVMQVIDSSRVWVALLVGLGGAYLLSLFWALSLAYGLKLKREIRFGWAQVGDRLEERFTLKNDARLPAIWAEIADQSDLPGYHANRVTGVDAHNENEWRTEAECQRRGLYTLGPTSLVTSDPFGMFSVRINDKASRVVMVMPPIVSLPKIEVAPGGRSGSGRPRPNAPERSVSVGGVREYAPGDSLHWVHWPTTARRNTYFVRLFDGTPTSDWRVLLDLDKLVQVGEGDYDTTEEHGVILAASLADRGLRLRRAVGLAVNSKQPVWLPPLQGENQRWDVLRALALVSPSNYSLGEYLRRISPDIHSHTSLIIITAAIQGDWLKNLMPLLWRGVIPTVLLFDPESFRRPVSEKASEPQRTSKAVSASMAELASLGVNSYIINRELLNQSEARPGHEGRWEWRVSPRGRAVATRRPSDLEWKVL